MSIFSKIKKSRTAAQEFKNKKAVEQEPPKKVPYKHIPQHAAIDALSGAPSAWVAEDRPKIATQKRRNTLKRAPNPETSLSYKTTASNSGANTPPLPKNSSFNNLSLNGSSACFDVKEAGSGYGAKVYRPTVSRLPSSRNSVLGPSPLGSTMHSEDGNFLSLPLLNTLVITILH